MSVQTLPLCNYRLKNMRVEVWSRCVLVSPHFSPWFSLFHQGMELRHAASTPSRWVPATFIDVSSMFDFPEEERLQLRMKFLYPEYMRSLSAVVDAAASSVEEAQNAYALDSMSPNLTTSAFDSAEALLIQLVAIQVLFGFLTCFYCVKFITLYQFYSDQGQARQMWQFASMLQFTAAPFASDPALRGIVLLVQSLTSTLIAYGRACSAPWVEFLPVPIRVTNDSINGVSDDGNEDLSAATASKDNVLLIALSKCKEVARNKARRLVLCKC
jgi:hypothetical protein